MAEFVELNLERSINELEKIEKYGLLKREEIKSIIKKRKAFEYKLRNSKKSKIHYLKYINYEQELLKLIKIRRKKMKIFEEVEDVDFSIAKKIQSLYTKVCMNNQGDVQLWFSYINFCKLMHINSRVSALFTRMLKVHSQNQALWIAAAKFEFEDNLMPNSARKILQRALRFHGDSNKLWLEYFRMELMYCEKIRKRKEILQGNKGIKLTDEEKSNEELVYNDDVLEGKIAIIIYQKAVERFNDLKFASDFLSICSEFDYQLTNFHKNFIYEDIKSRFGLDNEAVWDLIARGIIEDGKHELKESKLTFTEKLSLKRVHKKKAIEMYEEMVCKLQTVEMWCFYIKFCLEQLSKCKREKNIRTKLKKVLNVMKRAWDLDLLSIELFKEWIKLLVSCAQQNDEFMEIHRLLYKAANKWSYDFDFMHFCLLIYTKLPNVKTDVMQHFKKSLKCLNNVPHEKIIEFYENYLNWAKDTLHASEIKKIAKQFSMLNNDIQSRKIAEYFKPKYLNVLNSLYGINEVRKEYNLQKNNQPIVLDYFETMIEIEKQQKQFDENFVRKVYEDVTNSFGKDSASLWIQYIKFEMEFEPNNVSKLYFRAVKSLQPKESDEFVSKYSLLKIQIEG